MRTDISVGKMVTNLAAPRLVNSLKFKKSSVKYKISMLGENYYYYHMATQQALRSAAFASGIKAV